jgi:surfeit locus 1 family protein
MLVGPRMYEGQAGYHLYSPLLLLDSDDRSTVLVNRGWISKKFAQFHQGINKDDVEQVVVQALVRKPLKKNMFTPDNKPEKGEWYFPDIEQMASWTKSKPIVLEEIFDGNLQDADAKAAKGEPLGRHPSVNLRNTHLQYIFTWYALALGTSVGLWLLLKKPPSQVQSRVRAAKI